MYDSQLSVFRGRILRAAGVSLLTAPVLFACTQEVVVFDDGSGGASTSSSSSESSSTTASSSVGGSTSVGGSSAGGNTSTVAVTNASVGQGPTTITVGVGGMTSVASTGVGGGTTTVACFPDNGSPCPTVDDAEGVYGPCTDEEFLYIEQWLEGPLPGGDPDACCYEVVANDFCGVGRPYATHGGALVARPAKRADWKAQTHEPRGPMTETEREALVAAWTRDGLFEHASVASFSRFALELMSVGAPPELVAGAHRAALDEVDHARLCFALASRFAGEPVGPDKFPIDAGTHVRTDLVAIAAATAAEGCIGETLAACLAGAQRDAATDADVRAALYKIAEDEARHAELAWRTVRWAIEVGGDDVRDAVAEVFANARAHMISPASEVAMPSHGLLEPHAQTALQMQVLTDVIGPCANALLAQA